MSLRQSSNPYGYRDLLVYKKAEELQRACAEFTARFSHPSHFTLSSLADQMDRSARSVKQNIVEGWKRNSTKEYYDFLGFSIGANAELEEDCNDIIKGIYKMGGRGIKGEMGIEEVESLRFHPLDPNLPPLVQLKLRCKEMNFLFAKLQSSLAEKMHEDKTLSGKDMALAANRSRQSEDTWYQNELVSQGFVRLRNGQIVPKDEV